MHHLKLLSPTLLILSFPHPALSACYLPTLITTASQYDSFIATGDAKKIDNLSSNPPVIYTENDIPANISTGTLSQGLNISTHRTFYDPSLCKFTSEHVITDEKSPYVIVTQISLSQDPTSPTNVPLVQNIDAVITRPGDYYFNATAYRDLAYSNSLGNWAIIPEEKRDTRETLQAVADAYAAHLNDRSAFPVTPTCSIVSGGFWTGSRNATVDNCTHGPRKEGNPVQTWMRRRYVVDEMYGVVNVFTRFGGIDKNRPNETVSDSHLLRIEEGKLRFVHSATVCLSPGCGWV